MVRIGIADAEAAKKTSSYDAVDLLEDNAGQKAEVGKINTSEFRIDDDESSDESSGSESDSDVSEGSSSSSGSDSDNSSGSDSSASDAEDSTPVKSPTRGKRHLTTPLTSSSSASSDERRTFMSPLKRAMKPSAGHSKSLSGSPGSSGKTDNSVTPPPQSFQHTKRFPQFANPMKRNGKDKRGRHTRLATEDSGSSDDESSKVNGKAQLKNQNKHDMQPFVSKKSDRDFKVHDPSKFPLEQFTDAEYGISGESPPETYSYASSNPNDIAYNPRSLRKLNPEEIDNNNQLYDAERYQKRIIFWGIVIAMIMCLLIMIGSLVAYTKHMNVSPAPENLADLCSMTNIQSSKGHDQCEKACKEAECCMASGSRSCFAEQEDVCGEYAPCSSIHTNYKDDVSDYDLVVPPPPVDLNEICSDSAIARQDGFLHCQKVCTAGLCCFPSTFDAPTADGGSKFDNRGLDALDASGDLFVKPCWTTHEDVCSDYTPCQALSGVDQKHGSPTDLVKLKCNPHNLKFEDGREDCENICQTRSCCFANSKKRNCREDNEVWCNDFSPCEQLLNLAEFEDNKKESGDSSSDGDGQMESMEDTCKNFKGLSVSDLHTCEEICRPSNCCFYQNERCQNHIDCNFYDFCASVIANMNGHGVDELDLKTDDLIIDIVPPMTPVSPQQVEEACRDLHTSAGKDDCYHRCSSYRCCFQDDYDPISCHPSEICNRYTPCQMLEDLQGGYSPTEVIDACSDLSTPHGKDECYSHCGSYRCCFQDNFDPATCHAPQVCDQYTPCKKLNYLSSPEQSIKSVIDDICATRNILFSKGYENCEDVCAGEMCCFKAGGCTERASCGDFEACSILLDETLMGKGPDGGAEFNVDQACSIERIQNDDYREQCEAICESHSCCFDHSTNCNSDMACSRYAPCKNLPKYQGSTGTGNGNSNPYPKPTVNIQATCNIHMISGNSDTFFEEECLKICKPAECCRDDICRHVNDFCEHYTLCYSVWEADTAADLSEACADKSTAEGKAICGNACKRWDCCWAQDNNCFYANHSNCVEAVQHCQH